MEPIKYTPEHAHSFVDAIDKAWYNNYNSIKNGLSSHITTLDLWILHGGASNEFLSRIIKSICGNYGNNYLNIIMFKTELSEIPLLLNHPEDIKDDPFLVMLYKTAVKWRLTNGI